MSDLRLERFEHVNDFEDAAFPYLLEREAEHNVILGICSQIKDGYYEDFWLTAVLDGSSVVGVAYRTPPFLLGLAHTDAPGAMDLVADEARKEFDTLPGVVAEKSVAVEFCEAWARVSDQTASLRMAQRIYQALRVRDVPDASGGPRPAVESDSPLLAEWVVAFGAEANAPLGRAAEEWVAMRLRQDADSGLWVWEDGGDVVSMVAYTGPTPNGIRVNGVYTPPETRRHGYATACVAALTEWLLERGRTFCFLYTDLSNPTSNAIYQRIGYEPVCDVDQYAFH